MKPDKSFRRAVRALRSLTHWRKTAPHLTPDIIAAREQKISALLPDVHLIFDERRQAYGIFPGVPPESGAATDGTLPPMPLPDSPSPSGQRSSACLEPITREPARFEEELWGSLPSLLA